ncbi:hypothetical protein HanHA300_Chr03g0110321 [Helianthus annuus]|nr:hypothetical protein HanHA300_Chr03g0110321 [Helianthus annuus]KAJ0609650.1 hypothetical protein HanHA89_Chr03g0122281 [Helianthus annuus]
MFTPAFPPNLKTPNPNSSHFPQIVHHQELTGTSHYLLKLIKVNTPIPNPPT